MARDRSGGPEWAVLAHFVPRPAAIRIAVLALLGSITEGFGLLMLVPIVQLAADGTGRAGSRWAGFIPAGTSMAQLLAAFVALAMIRALIVQGRILAETQLRLAVGHRVRSELFRAFLATQWRYLSGLTRGEMMASSIQLVERVSDGCQQLLALIATAATLAVLFATALILAPLPTLVLGAASAIVLAFYSRFRRRAATEGAELNRAYEAIFEFFVQRLGALRLIKAFGNEDREAATADAIGQRMMATRLSYQRGAAVGQFSLQAGSALALALTAWLALRVWQIPLALLLPLIALCARSLPLLDALQSAWQRWSHERPALQELHRVLADARGSAEPHTNSIEPLRLARQIVFEQVSVQWSGRDVPAVANASFTMPAGSVTALVGPSGAGKSTIADIAGGLLAPDRGTLRVDDAVVEGVALRAWRRSVAYVQQEALLFSGTIRDNLKWASPDADDEKLARALADAAASFVFQFPEGLDTLVGDTGQQLSGGERQRIALARALLREPALLILDEGTSALDADNEQQILAALSRLKGRITILIIGHRGALLSLADQIIELRNGQIVRSKLVS